MYMYMYINFLSKKLILLMKEHQVTHTYRSAKWLRLLRAVAVGTRYDIERVKLHTQCTCTRYMHTQAAHDHQQSVTRIRLIDVTNHLNVYVVYDHTSQNA